MSASLNTKFCHKCSRDLPISKFGKCKRYKSGLRSQCKECEEKQSVKWAKNHRERATEIARKCRLKKKIKYNGDAKEKARKVKHELVLLGGGKCTYCGQEFPDCCYDFHHLNPEEKEDCRSYITRRQEYERKLKDGSAVLSCSNCHRIEHWKDKKEKLLGRRSEVRMYISRKLESQVRECKEGNTKEVEG